MSAGRGRGRGRGVSISFNIEQLGFQRGEALPSAALKPPSTYPSLEARPASLSLDEEAEELVELKKELLLNFQNSAFYFNKPTLTGDVSIDRFSDKRRQCVPQRPHNLDFNYLPKELHFEVTSKRVSKKVNLPSTKKAKTTTKKIEDLTKKLEELEAAENTEGTTEVEKKDGADDNEENEDEDENELVAEDDEELAEEENDYAEDYFDNGEDFLDKDGDEDGPTF